jgi:hypothetical protein
MNNAITMSAEFERQKNTKASAITLGVAGALILLFILVKWPLPTAEPVPVQEFIEVNLGNSDVGSGDDQPMLPGMPAPSEQQAYTPPAPVQSSVSDAKAVETDDRIENEDAPVVKTPAVSKPNATRIDNDNKVENTTPNPAPVVTQAPPKPKAVLGRTVGGNGNGGNGADTYKPGTGEGTGNGTGDQGRVGGSPNGRDYTGSPSNFGVRVMNIPPQSFEEEFDNNATIAMEVVADANGKVTSATYTSKGSTGTATARMKQIARDLAFKLKIGQADGIQKGVVKFNFRVK